jgi:hypothetical protein
LAPESEILDETLSKQQTFMMAIFWDPSDRKFSNLARRPGGDVLTEKTHGARSSNFTIRGTKKSLQELTLPVAFDPCDPNDFACSYFKGETRESIG